MVSQALIKELTNETACSHSKTKSSSCSKPKPGATTGGCAFEGAQIALFPFADVAHLVHAPATCLGASWETRQTKTSWIGRDFTQMGFCTDIDNNTVIFGGEKKLAESIKYIAQHYEPKAIFVYLTCVSSLIGEDVDSVCKNATKELGIPVISINAPGFAGNKNLGSRMGALDVLDKLIGTREPEYTTPFDINLIGDFNVTGDMWQYTPLLEELGIRILSTLSGDGRLEKIQTAHRAKLNVLVCAKALISVARKMEERYNIPFISVSFYGKRDTTNGILAIANALKDKALIKRAKELCQREEAKCEERIKPYKELFSGKKCILNTGGNKSWSIASALQDLGLKVVATSINKATEDDIARAKEILGDEAILMKSPANEQSKLIKEHNVDILLAGGRSLYTALKNKIAFVDVNQEKKRSYGGYEGLINLAEDIAFALTNPVFKLASNKAPWE